MDAAAVMTAKYSLQNDRSLNKVISGKESPHCRLEQQLAVHTLDPTQISSLHVALLHLIKAHLVQRPSVLVKELARLIAHYNHVCSPSLM